MARKSKEITLGDIEIRENSWIAKIAAKKLRVATVAIVINKTIYLHNISRKHFLQNKKWVKHELCHVRQFQQYGFISFIFMYLWQSLLNGYRGNKFEIAARQAENL